MARPIITFISDFGLQDWFVGVVHGVLHEVCPEARVVDLTHDIPPGHIARASFVLEAATPDFPTGSIHLAVVDPGVGTDRRAILARAHGHYFVGPDNGMLEWALCDPAAVVHELTDARYFRPPVSRTFHGRDVFAPVAGYLGCGVPPEAFGPRVLDPIRLPHPVSRRTDGHLQGEVMFIDRFGNALTNITAADLAREYPDVPEHRIEVNTGMRRIRGLSRSYGDGPVGTVMAVIGSSGRLEIAQVGGHCAERLGIGEGDRVVLRAIE
jgi:S-adenosyl-L-methionine hydrolase (adenosine-forming)